MSVNKAAQELGVPTGQATKYLDKIGINREKRPRIVGTEKKQGFEYCCQTVLNEGKSPKNCQSVLV